jgi:hypothetical protein
VEVESGQLHSQQGVDSWEKQECNCFANARAISHEPADLSRFGLESSDEISGLEASLGCLRQKMSQKAADECLNGWDAVWPWLRMVKSAWQKHQLVKKA